MGAVLARLKRIKGCVNCGYRGDARALHFDHIKPQLIKAKNRGFHWTHHSKKRVKEELKKCQVLCATCHCIRTAEEGLTRRRRIKDEENSEGTK